MKENVSERKVVYILYKKCLCVYDTDLNVGTLGSWETEINNKDNIKKKKCVCVYFTFMEHIFRWKVESNT